MDSNLRFRARAVSVLPVRDRRLASSSLQRRVGRTSNPAFAVHDRPYVRGRPPWFRSEEPAHMPEGLRKAGCEGTWSIRIQERQPTAGFWLCVQVGISACRLSSQSFLRLLTRRLEECPAAIADHPVARAGGIAGIAQVEPDDAHAAAFCGGEQPAHRNPAASALQPETTRVEALDCGGGPAVCCLTRAIVEIVREISRDDDQGFGPRPDSVEQGYNRFRRSIASDDRDQANSSSATCRNGK